MKLIVPLTLYSGNSILMLQNNIILTILFPMSIYLKCGSLDGLKGFPGSGKIHDMEKEMNYQFTPSQ